MNEDWVWGDDDVAESREDMAQLIASYLVNHLDNLHVGEVTDPSGKRYHIRVAVRLEEVEVTER